MTENLTFEEQKIQGYNRFGEDRTIPFFSRMIIKTGLAKDEKQAEKVLIIIAASIILISLILIIWSYQPSTIKTINIKS